MRVVLMVLVLTLVCFVCFEGFAASTYIKASDEKIGVVETTETTTELTVAEIKHEIEGIQNDLVRIEEAKQPFLDRLEKYEAMLAQCSVLGVVEPKPIVIDKPIEDIMPPNGNPVEHTI